jgi:hypothetical protein
VRKYHGLPLTPEADMLICMECKSAMVSMGDDRQIETALEVCPEVVGDSGAFKIWQQGGELDVPEYTRWVRFHIRHPAFRWALAPDVIDGTEQENDDLLREWLCSFPKHRAVPVFHLHESNARLIRLIAEEYPLIALGSSGEYKDPGSREWWDRIADLMGILCDDDGYPLQDFHGCRMLDPVLFSHIPFTSGDSCNVARNIGLDSRWNGPYAPRRRWVRAVIMINRIESHACASRWCNRSSGVQQNMELLG